MKILKTLIAVFAPLGFIMTIVVISAKFGIVSQPYIESVLRWIGYSVVSILLYISID